MSMIDQSAISQFNAVLVCALANDVTTKRNEGETVDLVLQQKQIQTHKNI